MLSIRYSITLSHEEIRKKSQNITKIKPFINKYNWEGINFPSEKDDCEKFEKNNRKIVLNALYAKKGKMYPAYVLKHILNRKKQVILLMISNGEGWYYITVKNYQHY